MCIHAIYVYICTYAHIFIHIYKYCFNYTTYKLSVLCDTRRYKRNYKVCHLLILLL